MCEIGDFAQLLNNVKSFVAQATHYTNCLSCC